MTTAFARDHHIEVMSEKDRELLEACRRGDALAWNRLLDSYERLVFSVALSYGLTPADAADITQLTFTIFLQNLDDLDDDSNLSAWLATVARRHTWRMLKKGRREQVHGPEDLAESMYMVPDDKGQRMMERWEVIDWLQQGMDKLDERCRTLLIALYFSVEKLSYAEIAERMGLAEGSIGPTRARCLERLKQLLESGN